MPHLRHWTDAAECAFPVSRMGSPTRRKKRERRAHDLLVNAQSALKQTWKLYFLKSCHSVNLFITFALTPSFELARLRHFFFHFFHVRFDTTPPFWTLRLLDCFARMYDVQLSFSLTNDNFVILDSLDTVWTQTIGACPTPWYFGESLSITRSNFHKHSEKLESRWAYCYFVF